MMDPHACRYAASLPPKGAQFAPWGGPSAQMMDPHACTHLSAEAAALSLRARNSRCGVVTRAAGEGPRNAGIDGKCESSHEADAHCNDARGRFNEARRRQ